MSKAANVSLDFAEALTNKFHSDASRENTHGFSYTIEVMGGRKYDRLVITASHSPQRSCFGFMDRLTGDLYKSAGWDAPAKGIRFSGDNLAAAVDAADPHGAFLYIR